MNGENREEDDMQAFKSLVTAVISIAFLTGAANADVVAPGDVKFEGIAVTQSLTGQPGDPEKGKRWAVGRKLGNCLACHANSDMADEQFHGETGPTLDGAGSRYDEATLRAILINSKKVFGDQTMMPAFYRNDGFNRVRKQFAGKTILTAQQIEDVVAYLITLKDE